MSHSNLVPWPVWQVPMSTPFTFQGRQQQGRVTCTWVCLSPYIHFKMLLGAVLHFITMHILLSEASKWELSQSHTHGLWLPNCACFQALDKLTLPAQVSDPGAFFTKPFFPWRGVEPSPCFRPIYVSRLKCCSSQLKFSPFIMAKRKTFCLDLYVNYVCSNYFLVIIA